MQKPFTVNVLHRQSLADTTTPVSIYLQIRDRYPFSLLLESADYHSNDNSFSFICCQPEATFKVQDGQITETYPDGSQYQTPADEPQAVTDRLTAFTQSFQTKNDLEKPLRINPGGLYGFMAYESVRYFEDVNVAASVYEDVPEMQYSAFRFVIAIDHFRNELHLFEYLYNDHDEPQSEAFSQWLFHKNVPGYHFSTTTAETCDSTDEQYRDMVTKGINHCLRGDVFQVVLSRRFEQPYKGDDFNVYRALRSVNPSPYLFYFDYGNFRIFGSSPEAQLIVKDRKAIIHPIAGTFKRTGNDEADAEAARLLRKDEKESAEHVMLVDLARNDLSRHATDVTVETFKEIQYFSHVIHLVSKVTGQLEPQAKLQDVVAATFPAGTLSGAPKHRALQIIAEQEKTGRSYYGGAIGFIGFNGDYNHAILIRSFLSQKNTLTYRAGAGVVARSQPESELQEVNNKIAALRRAIKLANTL